MNLVILSGNLGQDPELRYTPSGVPVARMSLATNERWTDANGEKHENTQWHRIVVWRKPAENATEFLSKGSKVLVRGKIETRSWEDRDGVKRYTTEIIAANIEYLDRNGARETDATREGPQSEAPDATFEGDTDIPF